mmetsp:Transcript_2216/g.3932  ORF Transcript_2216/g.3932 Transcript_2216/m.3932 type:complete len:124 (-) Transcript_2216:45-416(-)
MIVTCLTPLLPPARLLLQVLQVVRLLRIVYMLLRQQQQQETTTTTTTTAANVSLAPSGNKYRRVHQLGRRHYCLLYYSYLSIQGSTYYYFEVGGNLQYLAIYLKNCFLILFPYTRVVVVCSIF